MVFLRRFILGVLALTWLSSGLLAASTRKQPTRPGSGAGGATYKGAIVIDAATGNILHEEHADIINPPASMTKLMTFAVIHDRLAAGTLKLDTPVKIDTSDAKMGGTQVFLDPRETFSVEDLLYAMMIQSANDASHALARVSAGSVEAFVERMNAKATELGMTHTRFRTPHGLPPSTRQPADGDLTTPRDFSILARHLVQKTDVLKYTSVRLRPFGAGVRARPMDMKNHNNLLGKVGGVDGLKTGFTDAAGYCLTATAQRNGRRVIVVIMGALGPNGQRDLGRSRDLKAIELLERGFAALPPAPAPAATVAATSSPADSPLRPAPITPAPKPAAAAPGSSAAPATEPMIKVSVPKR